MDNCSTIERAAWRAASDAPGKTRMTPLDSLPVREASSAPASSIRYSICTLVNNRDEYAGMVRSFIKAGFDPAFCEYLYLDNSAANRFDGYRGYNLFLHRAQGQYIILCHQDILLFDDRLEELEARMRELERHDPDWALLGNAGGIALGSRAVHITDPDGDHNTGIFPAEVNSLDENFIVVRKSANLSLSHDLSGFHFYGTDICLIARVRGYRAWVVDFNLFHKSRGNCNQHFREVKKALVNKYRAAFKGRYVETTCTRFYLSGSVIRNFIFPLGIVRNALTNWQRQKRKWTSSFRKRRSSLDRVFHKWANSFRKRWNFLTRPFNRENRSDVAPRSSSPKSPTRLAKQ